MVTTSRELVDRAERAELAADRLNLVQVMLLRKG